LTAIKRLEAVGAGAPKGRTHHVALESNGAIHVFDTWDSEKDFEAFGAILMPILTELGALGTIHVTSVASAVVATARE
jgi:hypothetical protein